MIKFIDKDIDRSDRIVITHIVIQPLSEQNALAAIISHHKARHRSPGKSQARVSPSEPIKTGQR
jgi:hypothetical protein